MNVSRSGFEVFQEVFRKSFRDVYRMVYEGFMAVLG